MSSFCIGFVITFGWIEKDDSVFHMGFFCF